ncbi:hypothetical protein [Actinokineospora bangkokensis]|uniref:MalT-like TPR region domain-containing protein n=1 Tax=Actinokineospora bangkokensis TaxID=1193682 RepID=A0A1Q9LKI2_9PSEU|nr:hypothetical protein [Actinokineospora bangkokensis]OLR92561.1 hypothetical protein BJP25_21120 [Actinokineospora bangkokensis]
MAAARRPARLDANGLHLRARSLVLLGDVQRDRGRLHGPGSARQAYSEAHALFTDLGNTRRVAQVQLARVVVDEMDGDLPGAALRYRRLAADVRLSARDRARALLWVGTALSKAGAAADALDYLDRATTLFQDLNEPADWSVAHQKLALAHRDLGDLTRAQRHIDIALAERVGNSPLQRVRLDTAHGHLLLSDRATAEEGLRLLDHTATLALEFDLTHQHAGILGIRTAFDNDDHGRGTL